MLGSVARFEREITAERVSESMHNRALRGKWNGGIIPFGYTTYDRILNELTKQGVSKSKAMKKAQAIAPERKSLYLDKEEAEVAKQKLLEKLRERNTISAGKPA